VAARARPAEGLTVSLCLVVRDEEELLSGCLASAADAVDELVVVDSGSTDGTVAIAESFGARVLHVPWSGSFSEARNAGLEQATGDWILMLDADERLAPGAAPALRTLLGRTWREAFLLPLTSPTGPQTALRHPALRLWRNRPGYRFAGRVHEALAGLPTGLPERFELAPVEIEHLGYLPEHAAARGKTARNLALLELEPPGPARSVDLGSEYLRVGELERAAEHLDDAWLGICGDPGWPAVGFAPLLAARAARTRRELGRLEAARGLLGVALERLPDYTDLWFELAACATAAGDRAEAERLLERCLELGDAPLRYPATIGAGSRLARARLDEVRGG
jgi:tetratricopeptide (TPR) repeat protein